MARIDPVAGSIEISAAAGSFAAVSVPRIAFCASRCQRGWIVVKTWSPPERTVSAPYSRTSWSRT